MRTWLILLSGLLIWTAHFFAVYGVGEFAGEGALPRLAVIALTLVALLGCGAVLPLLRRLPQRDSFSVWRRTSALMGLGISALAILWQSLPALLS